MATLHVVRAFLAQEVDVAQLELLHTVDLSFVVVLGWWVDTLSGSVAGNDLVTISRFI